MAKVLEKFFATASGFLGAEEARKLIDAIENTDPIVSIRRNPRKMEGFALNGLRKVGWEEDGYYLSERPVFTLDPLIHAGAYYVQEASSMFLGEVMRQYVLGEYDEPRVLDLCAAPGGKSTHIAALLDGHGYLLSNEVNRQRARVLQENIAKWGYGNCGVCSCEPKRIGEIEGVFDVVVVDAPCSGEGMFRKEEAAIEEWSEENVRLCAERQRKILSDALPSLRTGGILVYSTCTFNIEEDERNCEYIVSELGCEMLPVRIDEGWGIVSNGTGYHFYPHRAEGEGFFLCAFRKTEEQEETPIYQPRPKKKEKWREAVRKPEAAADWINGDYAIEDGIAVSASQRDFVRMIDERLRLMQKGIALYEAKGKDLIPTHSLAMSVDINRDAFQTEDVDLERAIAFLRKENISLASEEKGWVLLTYRGVAIGWAKNIGGRVNNGYPQGWRILMQGDGKDVV